MSLDNVSLIPAWKGGPSATAADRLHELALVAEKNPQLWESFVLMRQSPLDAVKRTRNYQTYSFGCEGNLAQRIGLFQLGVLRENEEANA